jgi:hypothetical protein
VQQAGGIGGGERAHFVRYFSGIKRAFRLTPDGLDLFRRQSRRQQHANGALVER